MKLLLAVLFIVGLSLGSNISEEEYRKDVEYVNKVDRRLDELDRKAQKEGATTAIIDELNSYGYPLHVLKDKYLSQTGAKYEKFYERVEEVYNKVLYVKRGIFPTILKKEIRELHVPVCKVRVDGKRREILTIGIKDPGDENAVLKIMTQTQLQYAHLLGIESVNFEKCR